jgi:hypothetical protein
MYTNKLAVMDLEPTYGGTLNKVFQQGFNDIGGEERLNDLFNSHLREAHLKRLKPHNKTLKIKISQPVNFEDKKYQTVPEDTTESFYNPNNFTMEQKKVKLKIKKANEPKKPRGRPKKNTTQIPQQG